MRIAYVTMVFPAPSETFAANDLRTLVRQGEDVTVFTMRPPSAASAVLIEQRSLEALDIRSHSWRRTLGGFGLMASHPAWAWALFSWAVRWTLARPAHLLASLALLPSALAIFRDIDREGFDVVHLFWGHYPSAVGHLLQRFSPQTVRSMFLGAYDLAMAYGGSVPVARKADIVWTHARVNVPAIRQLGVPEDAIRVAYRGVDVGTLTAVKQSAAGERVTNRIVTAARLIRTKGVADAIHALVAVRERVADATLTVLGDGPDRAKLESTARVLGVSDAVEFLGHLPHLDALAVLARAQVFVLLSTKPGERLPNAVKEAMALGCICVVTYTPGIDELVRHERDGFVVSPNEVATTADWIARALAHGPDQDRMRQAAEHRIRESFDASASMATYRDEWNRLVLQRRANAR